MLKHALLTEQDTLAFAGSLAAAVSGGCFIYLNGDLGVGKTTFVRGFLRGLGFTDKVKSPTYTLIEPYDIAGRLVYHCDFYRIQDERELEELDIPEYFTPEAICLVEWPEKGAAKLPQPDLICALSPLAEGRQMILKSASAKGREIIERLKRQLSHLIDDAT